MNVQDHEYVVTACDYLITTMRLHRIRLLQYGAISQFVLAHTRPWIHEI